MTRWCSLQALDPLQFVAPYDVRAAVARILDAHGVLDDGGAAVAELAQLLDSAGARLRFTPRHWPRRDP